MLVFKIKGNTSEEKDWLKRVASWSLFDTFRIMFGTLLLASLLPRVKEEKMLEGSVLSVGFIKNHSI